MLQVWHIKCFYVSSVKKKKKKNVTTNGSFKRIYYKSNALI